MRRLSEKIPGGTAEGENSSRSESSPLKGRGAEAGKGKAESFHGENMMEIRRMEFDDIGQVAAIERENSLTPWNETGLLLTPYG